MLTGRATTARHLSICRNTWRYNCSAFLSRIHKHPQGARQTRTCSQISSQSDWGPGGGTRQGGSAASIAAHRQHGQLYVHGADAQSIHAVGREVFLALVELPVLGACDQSQLDTEWERAVPQSCRLLLPAENASFEFVSVIVPRVENADTGSERAFPFFYREFDPQFWYVPLEIVLIQRPIYVFSQLGKTRFLHLHVLRQGQETIFPAEGLEDMHKWSFTFFTCAWASRECRLTDLKVSAAVVLCKDDSSGYLFSCIPKPEKERGSFELNGWWLGPKDQTRRRTLCRAPPTTRAEGRRGTENSCRAISGHIHRQTLPGTRPDRAQTRHAQYELCEGRMSGIGSGL